MQVRENERIVAVTNLEGQVLSRSYLVGDLVSSETRFDGTAVSYDYDASANLSSVAYPGDTLEFTRDNDGLLTSVSNATGTVLNAYDSATGWLDSSTGVDGTLVSGFQWGLMDACMWKDNEISSLRMFGLYDIMSA